MEAPFVFGKIASAKNFTDRKQETDRLVLNFSSSVNSILIYPRRWGKSSLVKHAADIVLRKNRGIRFCFVDLNNVRTEEQFYQYFATAVLQSSSNKTKELIENTGRFLGRFIPNITFGSIPGTEFKLGMDWKEVKRSSDDILNLPERIGADKKIKLVVCIDEFQNISGFDYPVEFQKKLRAHWQRHNMVSYCLYGSKRHMLMDVFASPSMPFYKFGDIILLQKIFIDDWISFIRKRFADTGKNIENKDARLIAELADCHPYYVQQLAQQAWFRTDSKCSSAVIESVFNNLVLQLSMLFQNLVDGLSNTQVNFLKAIVNNVEQFSSQDTILEYGLGTSGNIMKIKKALMHREIIDIEAGRVILLDPLFKTWLKEHYFKNR